MSMVPPRILKLFAKPEQNRPLTLNEVIQTQATWNIALLQNAASLDEVRTKMDLPPFGEQFSSLGCTMQEAADALCQMFGSQREAEIVRIEKEVDRMAAAGIPPHLMYEDIPIVPCEMLVQYEECETEADLWTDANKWMRKDIYGCPFYRPD